MEELERHLLVKTAGWYYTSLFYRNLSARICSLYYFLLEGVMTGIWSVSLSYIQDDLNLSDSELGFSVLFSAVGTAVTAPITAFLLRKYGIQKVAILGGLFYSGFLPLLGISENFGILSFTMFLYGLSWGTVDICANSSAVLTEIVAGKALLGSFHGSYSLAAATGSLIGGLMTSNGVGIMTMFLVFCAICGILSVVFSSALYDFSQEQQITEYNNKMTALKHLQDQPSAASSRPLSVDGPANILDTMNALVADYDVPLLGDGRDKEHQAQKEDAQMDHIMEDKHHITYTTDWKTDANLWRHTGSTTTPTECMMANPEDGNGLTTVAPQHLRAFDPQRDRHRLLSDEIGSYEVRSSQRSSLVTITEVVNPHLLKYLCCLCFLAAFGEGSLVTWIIIYYDNVLHTSSDIRSVGFICFMVAMALGRFCCDYLRRKYGRKIMVFVGGTLSLGGLMTVFCTSSLPLDAAVAFTSIGLTVTGFGLSTLLPISFSSAGHLTELQHSGTAVATVAASAYCGSIVGSPLVGVLSDAFGSLRYGFLIVAVILGFIIPLSAFIPYETSRMMDRTQSIV